MSDATARIEKAASPRFFFKGQLLHLLVLIVTLPVAWALAARPLGDGAWRGVADVTLFWLAVGLAVVHQVVVWVVFRAQLGWGLLTRWFGRADMIVWGVVFGPLFMVRPLLVVALALADPGSLLLPAWVRVGLGVGLLVPTLYTLWSVARYFGLVRALGADHFRVRYRQMSLVREGAFGWSQNAMYTFAFLGLWSIALLLGSQAALSLALFQHAFVWGHYYGTEKPDMALIYGSKPDAE
jgi:hypothetical protein